MQTGRAAQRGLLCVMANASERAGLHHGDTAQGLGVLSGDRKGCFAKNAHAEQHTGTPAVL